MDFDLELRLALPDSSGNELDLVHHLSPHPRRIQERRAASSTSNSSSDELDLDLRLEPPSIEPLSPPVLVVSHDEQYQLATMVVEEDPAPALVDATPEEEEQLALMVFEAPVPIRAEDTWKIKRFLKKSDIGKHHRLPVKTTFVRKYIRPYFSKEQFAVADAGIGMQVIVWDEDTNTEHELCFKYWASNRMYHFGGKWDKEFVKRRKLQVNDEVGIYWDPVVCVFRFSVLRRAQN